MYEVPGSSLSMFVTDGEAEIKNLFVCTREI